MPAAAATQSPTEAQAAIVRPMPRGNRRAELVSSETLLRLTFWNETSAGIALAPGPRIGSRVPQNYERA